MGGLSTKTLVFGTPLWFGIGKLAHDERGAKADCQPMHTMLGMLSKGMEETHRLQSGL